MDASQKRKFLTDLQRVRKTAAEKETLRWNQLDIIDTAGSFLAAKKGASIGQMGQDVPEREKDKEKAGNIALIESSPGSGKTRIMGILAGTAADSGLKVLVITPRITLNGQTLRGFGEEIGIPAKKMARYDSTQSPTIRKKAKDAPILVGSHQSLGAMLRNKVISFDPASPNYRDLILIDEVHELYEISQELDKQLTLSDRHTLEALLREDAPMTLLLTGTDDGVSQRLFQNKVPTIYSKRLVQAVNDGLLCEVRGGSVNIGPKAGETQDNIDELRRNFSSHPNVIHEMVQQHFTHKDKHLGAIYRYKAIFFVDGKEAAELGAKEYNREAQSRELHDLKAAHISYKTPPKERNRILKEYEEGKITALFNDNILGMGFDDPETAIIHDNKQGDPENARAWAKLEQRGTRGARKCKWFEEEYGVPKRALLISYRYKGEKGVIADTVTYAELLKGLYIPPEEKGRRNGHTPGETEERETRTHRHVEVHAVFDPVDLAMVVNDTERMREERKLAAEKTIRKIPEPDGREYIPLGPIRQQNYRKYLFIFREVTKILERPSHKLADDRIIPREDVSSGLDTGDGGRIEHQVHPDIFQELDKKFEERQRGKKDVASTIPKLPNPDGREYIRVPEQDMETGDKRKHRFFVKEATTAQKSEGGHYTTSKKRKIPVDKLVMRVQIGGGQPVRFLHPDLYNEIDAKWQEQEASIYTEIPKVGRREYVIYPDAATNNSLYSFVQSRLTKMITDGDPVKTEKGEVPADKLRVSVKLGGAGKAKFYIHPYAYDLLHGMWQDFRESRTMVKGASAERVGKVTEGALESEVAEEVRGKAARSRRKMG